MQKHAKITDPIFYLTQFHRKFPPRSILDYSFLSTLPEFQHLLEVYVDIHGPRSLVTINQFGVTIWLWQISFIQTAKTIETNASYDFS